MLCGNRRERESETVSVESETREEKREMDENEKDEKYHRFIVVPLFKDVHIKQYTDIYKSLTKN